MDILVHSKVENAAESLNRTLRRGILGIIYFSLAVCWVLKIAVFDPLKWEN
jgi:hypothetical protein